MAGVQRTDSRDKNDYTVEVRPYKTLDKDQWGVVINNGQGAMVSLAVFDTITEAFAEADSIKRTFKG